jgi:SSS family solute:Na+ symporter
MGGAVDPAEIWTFAALVTLLVFIGFAAARWRRPHRPLTLEDWGVGGRAFGNWVPWFLLGGSMYTAYTYIAVPALTYGAGAIGFFAIPFAVITTPMVYLISTRMWSVSHAHGFVTSSEFVRARFGSRGLGALVAVIGLAATMPYIAVQLIALQALLKTIGVAGDWPLVIAMTVTSICTFQSGLRAPALLSIVKEVLLVWLVLALIVLIAAAGGLDRAFSEAQARFTADSSPATSLLLPPGGGLNYLTLIIGSALAIFAYPHAVTAILAAKDRATIKRNAAFLPLYCLVLGLLALLGFVAIGAGVRPVGGDLNTITPRLFHDLFPAWYAGFGYTVIAVSAVIPAAVMSIAAANLFTRSIYRAYLRPRASGREEAMVSRYVSLLAKFGALGCIVFLSPAFSVELQLIGGVVVLQAIPAAVLGLWTAWFHRWALVVGLFAGLGSGLLLLYQIPQRAPDGRIVKAHFGGSSLPLAELGLSTNAAIYVGVVALGVNLLVTVVVTLVLQQLRVPPGVDATRPSDYEADAGDAGVARLDSLVDGLPQVTDTVPKHRSMARR